MDSIDEDTEIANALAEAKSGGEALARFFGYSHLAEPLRSVSKEFARIAVRMLKTLPRVAERTAGLRKLLEAKDCAVRAALPE